MKGLDVVGFGALNVDKLFRVNRIAVADEESFVTEYKEASGGSAANTIVALARLGVNVGFIGQVGDDREGKSLLDDFAREHVNTDRVSVVKNGRSGKVMGFVDPEGQRALYIAPGVNDAIRSEDISSSCFVKTRFLHLTSFVGEQPFEAQVKIVRAIRQGTKISLDPGALYARAGYTKLKPIVDRATIVMPNATELELLTRKSDYRTGARFLVEKGVGIVAVKLGRKGCYVTDGKEEVSVRPFTVKIVDTTGAGDAFDAGFLFGLIRGKELRECARIGNFVASRCIMSMGARTSLPNLRDLAENKIV